ncbi:MAG TPA: hypothetical protein VG675_24680 [Bryobacteraceae bacterium]|nr:hypothetical protein [Bryobacteraceae bacterium]
MLRLCLLAAILCSCAAATETPTIDEAFNHLYDFDFPATHRALNQYISAHPQDPLPYAIQASADLFYELHRLGVLESEFLESDKKLADKKALQPDPQVRADLMAALEQAQTRASKILDDDPDNRNALFTMCISQGITTDYMALIEKHQFLSLSPAKKSNKYAQRLLKLDPHFYDAYLTAGLSEYLLGSLPFFVRWFVHFDNVSGSKDRAMENLRLVAREGHYLKPFAKILLGIIDLREKRPQEARQLLIELSNHYPNNPLFRTELAKLNTKLGREAN